MGKNLREGKRRGRRDSKDLLFYFSCRPLSSCKMIKRIKNTKKYSYGISVIFVKKVMMLQRLRRLGLGLRLVIINYKKGKFKNMEEWESNPSWFTVSGCRGIIDASLQLYGPIGRVIGFAH